jgi:hypothetical protein
MPASRPPTATEANAGKTSSWLVSIPAALSAHPPSLLRIGELAYHCCYLPAGQPLTLTRLTRNACTARPSASRRAGRPVPEGGRPGRLRSARGRMAHAAYQQGYKRPRLAARRKGA